MMSRSRTFDWERARAMLEDGRTPEAVVRELGITKNALAHARRVMGLPKFPKGRAPIDDEKVARLSAHGWTRRQIADELGVSFRTVERSRARIRATR